VQKSRNFSSSNLRTQRSLKSCIIFGNLPDSFPTFPTLTSFPRSVWCPSTRCPFVFEETRVHQFDSSPLVLLLSAPYSSDASILGMLLPEIWRRRRDAYAPSTEMKRSSVIQWIYLLYPSLSRITSFFRINGFTPLRSSCHLCLTVLVAFLAVIPRVGYIILPKYFFLTRRTISMI